MNFNILVLFICLHSTVLEHLYHFRKVLWPCVGNTHTQAQGTSDVSIIINFSLKCTYIKKIKQYAIFYFFISSLSIIFLKFLPIESIESISSLSPLKK